MIPVILPVRLKCSTISMYVFIIRNPIEIHVGIFARLSKYSHP